jgi:hypothetical protein
VRTAAQESPNFTFLAPEKDQTLTREVNLDWPTLKTAHSFDGGPEVGKVLEHGASLFRRATGMMPSISPLFGGDRGPQKLPDCLRFFQF